MTTNGSLLPVYAEKLKQAGLHRVTVSLDSLEDERFKAINGRGVSVNKVLEGIEAAKAAGLGVKINMVVQKGVNEKISCRWPAILKKRVIFSGLLNLWM